MARLNEYVKKELLDSFRDNHRLAESFIYILMPECMLGYLDAWITEVELVEKVDELLSGTDNDLAELLLIMCNEDLSTHLYGIFISILSNKKTFYLQQNFIGSFGVIFEEFYKCKK